MTLATLLLFAPPPGGQSGGGVFGMFIVQMIAIVAIIYFLLMRPKIQQEKKHRERLSQLKKGDEVVSVGGVVGEVIHLKDDRITIKSGESRLVIQRDRISEIRSTSGAESSTPAA